MDTAHQGLTRQDIDRLADAIAIQAARIDAATHRLLSDIRRFDEARGWAMQAAQSCAHWLTWRLGLGMGAAREKVRVAHALGKLPLIDAAFAKGRVSYSKVRAVTRVASADNEALLLDYARTSTGAQLEKICAKFRGFSQEASDPERRSVSKRYMPDATVRIQLNLSPDEAERFWQALSETKRALDEQTAAVPGNDAAAPEQRAPEQLAAEQRAPEQLAAARAQRVPAGMSGDAQATLADAAVAMAERQLVTLEEGTPLSRPAAERRQLFVHLREERIGEASHWQAELQDGTPLQGEAFKRLACDSGIVVAKLDAAGHVLDVGRRRRTVSPALRRALFMRDRHCQFPGCSHTAFVEAHHVEHWAQGGETSLENMLLACTFHHRALHEGGFSVHRAAAVPGHGDEFVFLTPDQRPIEYVPTSPSLERHPMATLTRKQQRAGIRIDRRTSLPNWDGTPRDINGAVGALIRRSEARAH